MVSPGPVESRSLKKSSLNQVLQNSSDKNSYALQHLIKTNPKKCCKIIVYEKYRTFDINVYAKSKINQTNHFMAKRGIFRFFYFLSKSDVKMVNYQKSQNITLSVFFQMFRVMLSYFLLLVIFCYHFWRKKNQGMILSSCSNFSPSVFFTIHQKISWNFLKHIFWWNHMDNTNA